MESSSSSSVMDSAIVPVIPFRALLDRSKVAVPTHVTFRSARRAGAATDGFVGPRISFRRIALIGSLSKKLHGDVRPVYYADRPRYPPRRFHATEKCPLCAKSMDDFATLGYCSEFCQQVFHLQCFNDRYQLTRKDSCMRCGAHKFVFGFEKGTYVHLQ